MSDLLTTLHPINDNNTDLYPNVKNENIPPVISGKDAMEALEGDFSTLKTDEIQVGGANGTLINKDQIVTQNKVINLDEIVDDAELAQGLNGKVDKVQGKGLSTNDFTNADKALVDSIPDKVNKEQGKGLSTNDFTNEYKKDLDQDIPDQIQLFKDAFEETAIAINGKVDKVQGKGLSTNDYTNADKALVDTIPDKVDKVQGKGLSTNDYTNADKALVDTIPDKADKANGLFIDRLNFTIGSESTKIMRITIDLVSNYFAIVNVHAYTNTEAYPASSNIYIPLTTEEETKLLSVLGNSRHLTEGTSKPDGVADYTAFGAGIVINNTSHQMLITLGKTLEISNTLDIYEVIAKR